MREPIGKPLKHGLGCVQLALLLSCGFGACVAAAANESELVEVEVAGTVDAAAGDVVAVLMDLERFAEWFPSLSRWQVLERDDETALVYGRQDLPWPVADRDYVVEYRWTTQPDGAFRLDAEGRSGVGPSPQADTVRLEQLHSVWLVRPEGVRAAVRYVYRGAPGGRLPDWVSRIGWRSHAGILLEQLEAETLRRVSSSVPAPRAAQD